MPIIYGTGGKTKWHRKQAGLPKTHYYDAVCVAGIAKRPRVEHSVLAIHAVGYGHRGDLGDHQTKQTAPGFRHPYTRLERVDGFQKLDTVAMQAKKGRVVGCINSFDKTSEGRPQRLRIKTDWTGGDGRVSGNVSQLAVVQRRDGYAYQVVPSAKSALY